MRSVRVFAFVVLLSATVARTGFAQEANGETVFNQSCAVCHADNVSGSRATKLDGLRLQAPVSVVEVLTTGVMRAQAQRLESFRDSRCCRICDRQDAVDRSCGSIDRTLRCPDVHVESGEDASLERLGRRSVEYEIPGCGTGRSVGCRHSEAEAEVGVRAPRDVPCVVATISRGGTSLCREPGRARVRARRKDRVHLLVVHWRRRDANNRRHRSRAGPPRFVRRRTSARFRDGFTRWMRIPGRSFGKRARRTTFLRGRRDRPFCTPAFCMCRSHHSKKGWAAEVEAMSAVPSAGASQPSTRHPASCCGRPTPLQNRCKCSRPARPGSVSSVRLAEESGRLRSSMPGGTRSTWQRAMDSPGPMVDTTDAILALDLSTGKIRWKQQVSQDIWLPGCGRAGGRGPNFNCPDGEVGTDIDFGSSPILATLPGGRQIIVAGQKSGDAWAFDPDKNGAVVWKFRAALTNETPGNFGTVVWGQAIDQENMYLPLSDIQAPTRAGGLHAINLRTGARAWFAEAVSPICKPGPGCTAAQAAAPTVISGVVFSGSADGGLRAVLDERRFCRLDV